MLLHGSCAASQGAGVLFLGPPGSGKSDLVLRLMQRGWQLVADDQVVLRGEGQGTEAEAPPPLAGLLEVRGVGIFQGLPHGPAPLRLVVDLAPQAAVPRLPEPRRFAAPGGPLPRLALHAFEASVPAKLELALAAAQARLAQRAGAFVA
ncbi:HPr kinase/phosphatase C-terminal domain-containing protein [Roseomonas sp. E05]|uniref:HPr kinase/phosphorylase n=1 Tax=Roseomonas sp. E05 TaxID=3046310 RepID=UPI0024BB24F4|nr:HPr kinase/phosphatase C-terminal domain-containing protein [Roseomonas sp. E05]MDJ0388064.1 HPr kinase/phosphatase C-terminal domain-containing protein [Roseomonas sp. E05]